MSNNSGQRFFEGTSHSTFDRMTLNSVGGNQTNDHHGWSGDKVHNDHRSFGTINGGYTEKDKRRINRNVESAGTYIEHQSGNSSGWSEYLISLYSWLLALKSASRRFF